jgi:hypothetical protein
MLQIANGDLGVLVGLWNLGVTVAYMAAAAGLASRREWGYAWGVRLATANIGFLLIQAVFWDAAGVSEEALYPLVILIVGDIMLAGTLLAVKDAVIPPPKPEEITTPPTLVAELNKALLEEAPAPASPGRIPDRAASGKLAATVQEGLITAEERDLLIAVRKAFIADQSARRLVQVRTDLKTGGEHVDLITRDWARTIFTLGRVPSQIYIYLFRPVVDEDLVAWMKRSVWKERGGITAIIAITASQRALNTCGGGLFAPGTVGIYTLRGGARCRKGSGRGNTHVFEKWYKKKWCKKGK